MVSSKQVAEMAGVSISTVSRVFSNPSLVNKKTLEKEAYTIGIKVLL